MGAVIHNTHCRVIGYVVTLALHCTNGLAMLVALTSNEEIKTDPELRTFYSLQWMYITIWNVVFQIVYSSIGLFCELPTLLNIKENARVKYLKTYREVLFAGLILPFGIAICTIFWAIYLYDRELVFPAFIDKVLSQTSNHVMHTAILPMVIWEATFLPRCKPTSHMWYFGHTCLCFFSYTAALFTTYARRGVWPYPILSMTYGSIYFYMIFMAVFAVLHILYHLQWPITSIIWRRNVKTSEKDR